ncbi:holdfast anchor protein HfaD [Asticcacaulis biprosthecium]|uniref:holdfast anchor protein HfaD n=1 Tax=Asticcacaulis biprosthecium TaxID=76891 RepID=UPI0012F4FF9D|nr:holdfast anchor protein HfaD [Asticcacaulis biprosthecium]
MPVRALTRTAGRKFLLAAAAAAAVAAPATSFSQEYIDNLQDSNGDVFAGQTLNVVQNDGLTKAEAYATGNQLHGGNEAVDATVASRQTVRGNVAGEVAINGQNTTDEYLSLGTPLYAVSQGIGNYGSWVATNGDTTAQTHQTATAESVKATTHITAPNNAIYVSGQGDARAIVNHSAWQVTNGRLNVAAWQTSSSDARANVSTIIEYSPSPNVYTAEATGNYHGSYSDDRGSQEHTVVQEQSGFTQARSEVFGGNMWIVATKGVATGNNNDIQNDGGSLVVDNHQIQSGAVQAQAVTEAYQYGEAHATAVAIGNNSAAGNNDIYLRLDNNQLSSGGVDATASFEGAVGYDAYLAADAVGNQSLGYACAECGADVGVNNNQVNNSDVSANAIANVARGRSIVSTARATGNSATYYATGSGN